MEADASLSKHLDDAFGAFTRPAARSSRCSARWRSWHRVRHSLSARHRQRHQPSLRRAPDVTRSVDRDLGIDLGP
jgi:hypothetical protein